MRCKLVLAMILAACGGGAGPSIALADYPQAEIDSYCTYNVRCGLYPDAATCAQYAVAPADPNPAAAVAANKMSYSGTNAKQCLDAIAAASCDQTQKSAREPASSCAKIFSGKAADNAACAFDDECQSRNCQLPQCTMACCTGTCGPTIANAQIGASCATADCVSGAFCDDTTTCRALLAQGASCASPDQCQYGLGCVGLTPGSPGMCGPLPQIGEACPDGNCADVGAVCNTSGMCAPVGLPGDACMVDFDCSSVFHCDTTMNKCAPYPTLNQPCTALCSGGAWCNIPAGQMTGTCAAAKANGQACSSSNECMSLYCDQSGTTPMCGDIPVCI